jgi:hypothetical protein
MLFRTIYKVVLWASLILALVSVTSSRPRKMQKLQSGMWGGEHIRLEINKNSASIEYDCAHGTINGPFTLNRNGEFKWRGTHTRESFGPVRLNRLPINERAIYTGSVVDGTMKLTVALAETNEVVDTFTLSRGSQGKIFKCK